MMPGRDFDADTFHAPPPEQPTGSASALRGRLNLLNWNGTGRPAGLFPQTHGAEPMTRPAVFQATALLLDHPAQDWSRPPARGALRGASTTRRRGSVAPAPSATGSRRWTRWTWPPGTSPPSTAAGAAALYLTYYTDGDTRRRGASLARLKSLYREHGWQPPEDELPDHLP